MNIIEGVRGSGRTTELVKMCAESQGASVIVVSIDAKKTIVEKMVDEIGATNIAVITFAEFLDGGLAGLHFRNLCFDDLDVSLWHHFGSGRDINITASIEYGGLKKTLTRRIAPELKDGQYIFITNDELAKGTKVGVIVGGKIVYQGGGYDRVDGMRRKMFAREANATFRIVEAVGGFDSSADSDDRKVVWSGRAYY